MMTTFYFGVRTFHNFYIVTGIVLCRLAITLSQFTLTCYKIYLYTAVMAPKLINEILTLTVCAILRYDPTRCTRLCVSARLYGCACRYVSKCVGIQLFKPLCGLIPFKCDAMYNTMWLKRRAIRDGQFVNVNTQPYWAYRRNDESKYQHTIL